MPSVSLLPEGVPLKVPAKYRPKKPRKARILSGLERTDGVVPNKGRQCGACHRQGHYRTSRHCPVKIKAYFDRLKATLDEIGGSTIDGHTDDYVDNQGNKELGGDLEQKMKQEPNQKLQDTRPIWPGRPEIIYRDYLARKADYMSQNPRCRSYRRALGLPEYNKRICMEHYKFLPQQRLDLVTETLLQGRPNWTSEEVHAWWDDEHRQEDEIVAIGIAKLQEGGRFGAEKPKELWANMNKSYYTGLKRDLEMYRFRD